MAFSIVRALWQAGAGPRSAPCHPPFRSRRPIAPRAPSVAEDIAPIGTPIKIHAQAHYLKHGRAYVLGKKFRLPAQIKVLKRIAKNGRDGFYAGEMLGDKLAILSALGTAHIVEGFATAEATWSISVLGHFDGFDVLEHRQSGQCVTVLLLRNILKHFDNLALGRDTKKHVHSFVEASELAYDARKPIFGSAD